MTPPTARQSEPRMAAQVIIVTGSPPGPVPLSALFEGDRFLMAPDSREPWTVRELETPAEADDLLTLRIVERRVPLTLPASMPVRLVSAPRRVTVKCMLCRQDTAFDVDIATSGIDAKVICEVCDDTVTTEVRAERPATGPEATTHPADRKGTPQ